MKLSDVCVVIKHVRSESCSVLCSGFFRPRPTRDVQESSVDPSGRLSYKYLNYDWMDWTFMVPRGCIIPVKTFTSSCKISKYLQN